MQKGQVFGVLFMVLWVSLVVWLVITAYSGKKSTAVVEDVRVITTQVRETQGSNKSADAAIGAIIGGSITGGIGGAAIGAAIGADGKEPATRLFKKIETCMFIAKIPDGRQFKFFVDYEGGDLNGCALLHRGDVVPVVIFKPPFGSRLDYLWGDQKGELISQTEMFLSRSSIGK
jgi:hypothetical protein